MAGASCQTNPIDLEDLLGTCHKGTPQIPDVQLNAAIRRLDEQLAQLVRTL